MKARLTENYRNSDGSGIAKEKIVDSRISNDFISELITKLADYEDIQDAYEKLQQIKPENTMTRYLVVRPTDSVIVTILKNKSDNSYSFVNLTKLHICPCHFKSIEDALKDMDNKVKEGEILMYKEI